MGEGCIPSRSGMRVDSVLITRQGDGGEAAKKASDLRRGCSEGVLNLEATQHGGSRHVGVEPVEGTRFFWRCGSSRTVSYREPRSARRCGGEPSPREHVPVTVGARGQLRRGMSGESPTPRCGGSHGWANPPGFVPPDLRERTRDRGSRVCPWVVLCCTSRQAACAWRYSSRSSRRGGQASRREDPHQANHVVNRTSPAKAMEPGRL